MVIRMRRLLKDTFRSTYLIVVVLLCSIIVTSCGTQEVTSIEDGSYKCELTMEGGTGKAYINSPVDITIKNGSIYATLVWSSENYDYMIVDDNKYLNENPGGYSTFTIPISDISSPLTVTGDTVAMSRPHEIEYVLTFGELTRCSLEELTGEAVELKYANQFAMTKYNGCTLIDIKDGDRYLVVDVGGTVPEGIGDDVVVLKKPLDKTYLVSTSVMDLLRECDCLDSICLSGTKEEDWAIEEAADLMHDGKISYAGKYSAPDYELILSKDCNLAIENTMIFHTPEVKEKLEALGIPVLVERSSYEEHPLGRLEWIKLYGVLYDREDVADTFYDMQLSSVESILEEADTGKSVAFFYVTTNGSVNVRKPNDYIARMIDLAGGEYVLKNVIPEEENALSTMNMQMEEFYLNAKDADVIVYNSTIMGEIGSISELIDIDDVFTDFTAVKSGNVYCTSEDFFQKSTGVTDFTCDLHSVLTGNDSSLRYLKRLK